MKRLTGMILRSHNRSDGEVNSSWPHSLDARIPSELRDSQHLDHHPPRVAEHSPYAADACGDGRHLFDIVESVVYREVYDDQDQYVRDEEDFRSRLTCVRCGRVAEWEGTRERRVIGRLQVEPIVVGELSAQHVHGDRTPGSRDYSNWLVYRAGEVVGTLRWASGARGRAHHLGRLDEWEYGVSVEGKDPAGALRAIARAEQKAAVNA